MQEPIKVEEPVPYLIKLIKSGFIKNTEHLLTVMQFHGIPLDYEIVRKLRYETGGFLSREILKQFYKDKKSVKKHIQKENKRDYNLSYQRDYYNKNRQKVLAYQKEYQKKRRRDKNGNGRVKETVQ